MNSAYPDCASQIRAQPYEVILKGFLWTLAARRYIWTHAGDAAVKAPEEIHFIYFLHSIYVCLNLLKFCY